MRFNKPWKVRQWWPVFTAMPRMLRGLGEHPELGLPRHPALVRTHDGAGAVLAQLRGSRPLRPGRDLPHLEPWRRFNRRVRATGDVGIWHETYQVRAGEYEAIYGNMPVFGLAAAGEHVPAGRKANSAAARIGATEHRCAGRRAVLHGVAIEASAHPSIGRQWWIGRRVPRSTARW